MNTPTFQNLNGVSSEKGGALIYILIAIALLAALTTTFIQPGGQSSRTQNAFKLASELTSQSRVIRSGIQDCILRYPQGDNAIAEGGYIDPYPLNPDSADIEYAAYDVTNKNVSNVRCPGAAFEIIFGGSGLFTSYLPPAPTLMEEWQYFNGNATGASQIYDMDFNGVFYEVKSDKSDPFIAESMQKVDGLMSACEVDHTVGDGTNGCENGHQCLRFWIIRRSGGPTGAADATNGTNPCP